MLTQEQIDFFQHYGFLVLPGVLSSEQVDWLRAFLEPKFGLPQSERLLGDLDKVIFDIYSRYPEIRWLLFNQTAVEALRSLLGDDFVLLRESSAARDFYADGWHKDSGGLDKFGHHFHHREDYQMIQTAYYLQDNDPYLGGGLDVEPGSHRLGPDPFVLGQPYTLDNPVTLPIKAGDFVLFHYRTVHRATPRLLPLAPDAPRKMAIFCGYSSNSPHVQPYHEYVTARYDYLKGFRYPQDLQWLAASRGVTLA